MRSLSLSLSLSLSQHRTMRPLSEELNIFSNIFPIIEHICSQCTFCLPPERGVFRTFSNISDRAFLHNLVKSF